MSPLMSRLSDQVLEVELGTPHFEGWRGMWEEYVFGGYPDSFLKEGARSEICRVHQQHVDYYSRGETRPFS